MRAKRLSIAVLSLLLIRGVGLSQEVLPLQQLEVMRNKYPGQNAVYLHDKEDVLIDFRGDSIIALSSLNEDLLLLTDQANIFADEKIYYSYFSKVSDIEAQTLLPEEKKYKSIKVTAFKDNQEYSSGIFYDDLKSKSFVYPAVKPGARTVMSYKKETINPRLLSSFYFAATVPVEVSELVITVNKNIKLNYKLFNTESIKLEHTTKESGKFIIHTWRATNLKPYPYEEDAPAGSYYMPHILYYIEEANGSKFNEKILADVDDLHKWYYGFVEKVVESKDDLGELKEVVDSLTNGVTDEIEKVKRIYYWVQDNISYVAIETGYRGFIPHKPQDIYKSRFGDCKDMATIIYTMLKHAGIKSYLTWIGSRDIPYSYSDCPCPAVDNHMITTYMNGDNIYFLDATSNYTPFGLPSSHTQGKEALISMGKDKYIIRKVPALSAAENKVVDTVYASIDGKKLKVDGRVVMNNYYKVINTYWLADLSQKKQKEELTSMLRKGNNKFLLDTFMINNLREREMPLTIDYKGTVDDYIKQIDGEIYVNLNLEKPLFHDKIDTSNRKVPRKTMNAYQSENISIFTVPKGYKVERLPSNVSGGGDIFNFKITYETQGDKIICNSVVSVNLLILQVSQFSEWNKMIERLSEAYRDVVILKAI